MEISVAAKDVRVSARKARLVAKAVKNLPLPRARDYLSLLAKKGARPVLKALESAVANARNKKLDTENLKIKNILVDEGRRMKRRDKSRGARFGGGVIQKRMSHIKIVLEG